jgi:hypothetical protein
MRTYGRITNGSGSRTWVEVDTAPDGSNDMVFVTTLCQVLALNLNESPFYATYGIPQVQTILQQIYPDYYVALTQQRFASQFAALQISRATRSFQPFYNVIVTTHQGVKINATVVIPK